MVDMIYNNPPPRSVPIVAMMREIGVLKTATNGPSQVAGRVRALRFAGTVMFASVRHFPA